MARDRRMSENEALDLVERDGLSAFPVIEENCPARWKNHEFVIAVLSILCDDLCLPWGMVVPQLREYVEDQVWNRISRKG